MEVRNTSVLDTIFLQNGNLDTSQDRLAGISGPMARGTKWFVKEGCTCSYKYSVQDCWVDIGDRDVGMDLYV